MAVVGRVLMRRTWFRSSVLVLVFVVASSPVFAGSRTVTRSAAPKIPSVFATVWQALRDLLPAGEQTGVEIDPNGPGTATTPPSPEDPGSDSDRGPGVDPWG
jgi:hypothetical protein